MLSRGLRPASERQISSQTQGKSGYYFVLFITVVSLKSYFVCRTLVAVMK